MKSNKVLIRVRYGNDLNQMLSHRVLAMYGAGPKIQVLSDIIELRSFIYYEVGVPEFKPYSSKLQPVWVGPEIVDGLILTFGTMTLYAIINFFSIEFIFFESLFKGKVLVIWKTMPSPGRLGTIGIPIIYFSGKLCKPLGSTVKQKLPYRQIKRTDYPVWSLKSYVCRRSIFC